MNLQQIAAALAACLALAACGGEEAENQAGTPQGVAVQPAAQDTAVPGPGSEPMEGGAELTVNGSARYGDYVADRTGRALYLFTADSAGQSRCYDQCAALWPPLLAPQGTPTAGSDRLQAPLIGTTTRRDGSAQVTYNGHPLYYYARDRGADEPRGQDVHDSGGGWYLVTPAGSKLEKSGGS